MIYDLETREIAEKPIKEITTIIRKALDDLRYYDLSKQLNELRDYMSGDIEFLATYNKCRTYQLTYEIVARAKMIIQICKDAIKLKKDLHMTS